MHRDRGLHGRLLCGTAAIALLLATGAHAEQAKFNIAAQPLADGLNEFAKQSGRPVMFTPEVAGAKMTHGVTDVSDPEKALALVLADTGLTWRKSGDTYLIVSASAPQSGSAAGDGADAGTVAALVVTAQKREENIQDVPIAMSAFTQESLERSQIAGGPDLMTQVPNMTFTKTNFTSYSIQIRGIGTQAISATTDPAVAIAFNNTPFVRNHFFEQEFYDLQRVEVLRGPQGTLYGRNATAGVVNIISAKPTFRYEGKLSGDVANYNSTRIEGMLNLPLAEDKAALRIAGAWTKRDGYAFNEMTGRPIDGRDLWSTRVSLRVEPTDRVSTNLVWEHFEENDDRLRSGKQLCKKHSPTEVSGVPLDFRWWSLTGQAVLFSQGCTPASMYADESFQTPNGFSLPYYLPLGELGLPSQIGFDPYLHSVQSRDLRVIESSFEPRYRAKADVTQLQLAIDLSDQLTLNSETAYSTDFIFSTQDYNRFTTTPGAFRELNDRIPTDAYTRDNVINNGVFCDPQVGCSDRVLAADLATAKSRQFSQELRLSSNFDGPANFSLGANFLRYDTEDKYYVFLNTVTLTGLSQAFGFDFEHYPGVATPWQPGVSDNRTCMARSWLPGDLLQSQRMAGCLYIDPNPIDHLNDQGHNYFLSKNPYKLISYALFGETYYEVTPELKLTAGLRFTVDRKEAPRIPSWLLAVDTIGYPVYEVIKQEWREPTGRLSLDWKPDLGWTDQTLLYASYSHGYKAGGANPPPTAVIEYAQTGVQAADLLNGTATHPKTFKPEFVDAFEIGSKNTMAQGRLVLNGNAFYYDYKGYQISQIVDRSANNLNFDARVWGLEVEADWNPLENLKLGFKGGYENTRVADGMKAIDLMDRTAGDPNWVLVRPYPTTPSNCIVPTWIVTWGGQIHLPPDAGVGFGPCIAYVNQHDPVTNLPYVKDPQQYSDGFTTYSGLPPGWEGYPGFDPASAPNNGEGISKDLSGNELPNAPHFTATVTADYTLPLPHDWLATFHTDLYYQSEAWTRIFNMPGYDRLKAYTNVNLAAIFTNEDAGWRVMAYVKNVFDRDSITGAFLNSDDTGLTTNVFLTEPRLYGLRVTKEWRGGGVWGDGARRDPNLPFPLRVEVGASVQRHDAPYATITPEFVNDFSGAINPLVSQHGDLDWGDGREIKVTYQPGAWQVSAAARFGKTNVSDKSLLTEPGDSGCLVYTSLCEAIPVAVKYPSNYSRTDVRQREDHTIVDFMVGRDAGVGSLLKHNAVSTGLRYAQLNSRAEVSIEGIPDWDLPLEWGGLKYARHHRDIASIEADRSFEGTGPFVSWDAAKTLWGRAETGRLTIDWSVGAGVLFGRQNTTVRGNERSNFYDTGYLFEFTPPDVSTVTLINPPSRSKSVTAPLLDLAVGLSYEVDRFSISTGYRWERYFNAIDGGYDEHKSYDRTIDGPYFKIAVGFGG